MAQALEKRNMYPKLIKWGFFAQRTDIFFQNSVFDEIQFSQKSLINRKKSTSCPSTTRSGATNPYSILLLLQAPAQR